MSSQYECLKSAELYEAFGVDAPVQLPGKAVWPRQAGLFIRKVQAELEGDADAIREAIRLFETHVEDPLRIPDVAAAVDMSGRHFERLFKRETGQSPLRYYRHLRLSKARQRVLYSNDSFREIAVSVGYPTPAPMARHYQELFGVSPKDERRLASGLSRAVPVAAE